MATTEIVKQEDAQIVKQETFAAYIRRPEVMDKFALVMKGDEARRAVQSVIILYETAEPGDYSLQNCSNRSIVRAALRAATQHVSVDPAEREAFLIPRKVNRMVSGKKEQVLEACFSFHYNEIENRAWRTGIYTHINVSPIFEGTEILENIYTGLHVIRMENGLRVHNQGAPSLRSWAERDNKKRIGWLGYYRTRQGREKTVYMTIADIEKTVAGGNKNWTSSFGWTKHRETMERKTVLLALLRLADLKAPEMANLREALDVIDEAETSEVPTGAIEALPEIQGETIEADPIDAAFPLVAVHAEIEEISAEEAAYIQACEVTVRNKEIETTIGKLDQRSLEYLSENSKDETKKKSAQSVINWRKKNETKILNELGLE